MRVHRLAAVMVIRFMAAKMGMNERCAQRRGLDGHRQPNGNQLAEHRGIIGLAFKASQGAELTSARYDPWYLFDRLPPSLRQRASARALYPSNAET